MKKEENLRQIVLSRYSTKKEKEDALDALLALVAARANRYWSFRESDIVENLDDIRDKNGEKDNFQNSNDICHGKEVKTKTLTFHDWLKLLNEKIFDCGEIPITLPYNQTEEFKREFRTKPITLKEFYTKLFGEKRWDCKFRI